MSSLFNSEEDKKVPLAARVRPKSLSDFLGQRHLVGEDSFIRKIIEEKEPPPSIIFWGPPVGRLPWLYCWQNQQTVDL